ncbi:MAG: tRNA preQ1(34) S-adenosylmethionine ribosyltransferase-isomerase QueA [Verrucomicrobiota bacterium]|nr:tRNA preQ1(34) S-adenosylmethionine ribosyltransferase-isomerase QueA [Verrucomicrobiota bacterium]
MSLLTSDYQYALPEKLIARHPLPRREDSRMMILDRRTQRIEHRRFTEFPSFVDEGDLVVLNDTRVVPARVYAEDGRIELLFVEAVREHTWKCLVKPGRKMGLGALVHVGEIPGVVFEICPDGERIIEFHGPIDFEKAGEFPLPPYLDRELEPSDRERYQTVFAREAGAIAAPTAGLHFTPEMLAGLPHAFVTLHVGIATFRPVQVEDLTRHPMPPERFRVSPKAAESINAARRRIAVGTTTTRVLEARGLPAAAGVGAVDLFIHPPYRFHVVDLLLTNFHLPKSTLLMLISAFAGREFVLRAYEEAVREQYRFYSYGDCMLIL